MKKKGILLALLVLALTMTVAVATAECAHTSTHWEHDQTTHLEVCNDCGATVYGPWEHSGHCSEPGVCDLCGATDVTLAYTSHGDERHWEYDQTTHWEVCDNCGEIAGPPWNHYSFCNSPNVCYYCGATDVTMEEIFHENVSLAYDQTTHWEVCDDCGEIAWGPWEHTDRCNNPGVCDYCGVTDVTIGDTRHGDIHYEHDQTTHWQVCDDCGEIVYEPWEHYGTCTSPDVCYECGATGVTMADIYHSDTHYEYNQTTHWQVCDDCGEIVYAPSEHNERCTNLGVCDDCGATGVTMGYIYHSHRHYEYDQTTCWEVCDDCGEIAYGPSDHCSFCDNPNVCRNCGATGVTIAHTDHPWDYFEWHITDTTHEAVCTLCGQVTVEQEEHYEWCDSPGGCYYCEATGVTIGTTYHTNPIWAYDQTTHWEVCEDCGEIVSGPWEHEYACDLPGACWMCGATDVTFGGVEHYWSSDQQLSYDSHNHWFTCTVCGELCTEPHYTLSYTPAGICSACGAAYSTAPAEPLQLNGVTVSGDLKVGSTLTATISATGATYYSFWVYDTNNNLIVENYMTTSSGIEFSVNKPGGYVVLVAVSNGVDTISGNSDWFVVTGDPVTITSLSISGTQEVGSAITATVVSPTATAYSYWLYDGNATLLEEVYMTSSNTYTFTPEKSGIYNVFVAVTDGAIGAQANTGWFPVKGDPVVINNLSVDGEKKPGSPLTVTVDATGATGFSYWFYNADGTLLEEAYMVTTNTYTFTPETAGGYNVFVAVTDGVSSDQENSGWFMVE